ESSDTIESRTARSAGPRRKGGRRADRRAVVLLNVGPLGGIDDRSQDLLVSPANLHWRSGTRRFGSRHLVVLRMEGHLATWRGPQYGAATADRQQEPRTVSRRPRDTGQLPRDPEERLPLERHLLGLHVCGGSAQRARGAHPQVR